MNDNDKTNSNNSNDPSTPETGSGNDSGQLQMRGNCGRSRRGRLWLGAIVIAGAGFVAGAATTIAGSAYAFGNGFRHHHSVDSIDEARELAADKAGWVAAMIDADDTQETQIREIGEQLAEKLYPLRGEHRANRAEMVAELLSGTPDALALEAIRKSELALADDASASIVTALDRLSRTLTDEQRAKIARRLERMRH